MISDRLVSHVLRQAFFLKFKDENVGRRMRHIYMIWCKIDRKGVIELEEGNMAQFSIERRTYKMLLYAIVCWCDITPYDSAVAAPDNRDDFWKRNG